jgi:8-oxo-dGTP pyrophosphatase MutT (NUDIX family)
LKKDVERPTKIDEAAGGVVVRLNGGAPGLVLIRTEREGVSRWSLPKGHYKKRESTEQAALREVREETGLVVEIVAPLGTLDYWFTEGRFKYHKFVHFYVMRATGGSLDAHDHEVAEARWFTWDEGLAVMAYETERALVESARAWVVALLADTD